MTVPKMRLPYSKMVQLARLARDTGTSTDLLRRVVLSLRVKVYLDSGRYFVSLNDRQRILDEASRLLNQKKLQSEHRNLLIALKFKEDYVYFFRSGAYIKIGLADNVHRRRQELQVGNPVPVVIVAYILGGAKLEEEIQSHFGDLLVQGEWFREEGDLLDLVAHLSAETSPVGTTARFKDLWRFRNYIESRRNSRNLDFPLQAADIKGE